MKKLLSLLLVLIMTVSFVSCGIENGKDNDKDEDKEYLFGMGTVANDNTVTVAAVIVDEDGNVVNCKVDAVEIPRENLFQYNEYLVPRLIIKERFENEILGKLDQENGDEKWAHIKLGAFNYLYDPNDTTKPENVIKAMQDRYPITQTGVAVYAITDIVNIELVELQRYIQEYIPEYTYADMEYDHRLSGYESDVPKVESKKATDEKWCELAEEFENECIGKSFDEINKLDKKYSAFVLALETAIDNADKADVSKEDEIGIGITPKFYSKTLPLSKGVSYRDLFLAEGLSAVLAPNLNIGIVAVAKTEDNEVSAIASDMLAVEDYAVCSETDLAYSLNVDFSEYKTVLQANDNEELIEMLEDLNDECEGEDIEDIEEYCGKFEPYLEQALLKAVK